MLHQPAKPCPPPWIVQSVSHDLTIQYPEMVDHRLSFLITLNERYHDFLVIYTDGSKFENGRGVGAAFVIPSLSVSQLFKLPEYFSIFQAEVIALHIRLFNI